ncbi:MAG: hypothetical protein SFU98_06340 [Leptospiraceae bacterium]|nr:hypothetical protein [Leptospiraceae bacterium]
METKNKLDINLKRSFLDFFSGRLLIDGEKIEYRNNTILCSEVKEIRYGIIQIYTNGMKTNRLFEIGINGNTSKPIRITFQSIGLFSVSKTVDETYQTIVNCLWENVTLRLVNEAIQNLENGKPFITEKLEVQPKGVQMNIKNLFGKNEIYFVEWKNLLKSDSDGFFSVYSNEDKKAAIKLNFQKDWNTPVLASLLDYLWKDGRAYTLAQKF